MRFFLDNNLAPKHAEALHALHRPEHEVRALRSKFAASTSDDVWIAALAAERDWIVISGDMRIARNSQMRAAYAGSNLRMFFLERGWMKLTMYEQHARLTQRFPRIIELAQEAPDGCSYSISLRGRFQRLGRRAT